MFYSKLNINGVEYKLYATLTGEGPPPESLEAEVGMRYMDTESEAYYKRTNNGWVKEIANKDDDTDGVRQDSIGVSFQRFSDHVVEFSERLYVTEEAVGNFEAALDATLALCDSYIGGEAE